MIDSCKELFRSDILCIMAFHCIYSLGIVYAQRAFLWTRIHVYFITKTNFGVFLLLFFQIHHLHSELIKLIFLLAPGLQVLAFLAGLYKLYFNLRFFFCSLQLTKSWHQIYISLLITCQMRQLDCEWGISASKSSDFMALYKFMLLTYLLIYLVKGNQICLSLFCDRLK